MINENENDNAQRKWAHIIFLRSDDTRHTVLNLRTTVCLSSNS